MAWAAFNRAIASRGDVGIWHETYCVRARNFECIYNNMPPFGLGKATRLVPARGLLDTAAGRMNQQHACPSFVFALHLVPFTKSPEARSYRVSKAWVWVGLPLFCKGPSLASVRLRQRVMLAFGALLAEGDVPYVFPTLNQKLHCPINVQ